MTTSFKFNPLLIFVTLFLTPALTTSCKQEFKREVHYQYYADYMERQLPDFSTLGEPDAEGVLPDFSLTDLPGSEADHYAVLFTAKFDVAKPETYTFYLTTDDGSRFFVDGNLLIDDDGARGGHLTTCTVDLGKGIHDLRLEYFEFDKGQDVNLMYTTPSTPFRNYREPCPDEIPDAMKEQIREAYGRYAAWKGDDETVVFPILTDIHTTGRETWRHIGYTVTADDLFHFDFMANFGDLGVNLQPAGSSIKYSKYIIDRIREQMFLYKGVFLYAAGNHDWDGGEGTHYSSEMLSDWFQKPSLEAAGGNLHLTDGQCWCWYDIPAKQTRIFILNSQATETLGPEYYCYDTPQLEWLADRLCEVPEGYNVFVFSHYMPNPTGRWSTSGPVDPRKSTVTLMKMLSDYKARRAGAVKEGTTPASSNVKWDFTAAKGRLAGMLGGDSHVNVVEECDGVTYFITQGYGTMRPEWSIPGQKHVWFDYREELCVDVVAFKPATGEVHTFRIGAGGAGADETWKVE